MPAITDPNEPYFKDGIWGWDGALWRKLPLVFGYSDTYLDLTHALGTGGDLGLNLSVVPAGEIWVVSAFSGYPLDANHPNYVYMGIKRGAAYYALQRLPSLAQNTSIQCPTPLYLEEDDRLAIVWDNAVLNKDYYAYAHGYKMLIAE